MAMAGMENISEAVLSKVGAEAESIIKDAEKRAKEEIDRNTALSVSKVTHQTMTNWAMDDPNNETSCPDQNTK